MAWTDDRVEILKKLWAEGLSASQIANKMGEVTRNAVIGKVHRLGLPGRATTTRSSARRLPATGGLTRNMGGMIASGVAPLRADQGAVKTISSPPMNEGDFYFDLDDPTLTPLDKRIGLMDLTESMCKWPIGDPCGDNFHYCGAHKHKDGSYCEHHGGRASPKKRLARKKVALLK